MNMRYFTSTGKYWGGARASVSRAGLIRHKSKQLTLNLDRFGVSLMRKLQSCEVVEVNFDVT